MARVVILGAGIAGHTASTYLARWLGGAHEVVVISPKAEWNWIPSNIWVGVGEMMPEQVIFELAPVYEKAGIVFHQARALSIHPEGNEEGSRPYVMVEYTDSSKIGHTGKVYYDYIVNATGPKLNFDATEGLGPEGYSTSVCTQHHAQAANEQLQENIKIMRSGHKRTFLVGTGHGMCTCQGAAFEYIFNLDQTLRQVGVRDHARLVWLSNEYEVGDFGMGGMHLRRGGYITNAKVFTESLMAERGIEWITRAHVTQVESGKAHYENLAGEFRAVDFDFAMLIPPFAGVGLQAFNKRGEEITEKVFAPNSMMKVDADYTLKPYAEWKADDWPETYQNPTYNNIFAAGIAFAPPHLISKPMQSPNGTPINPAPPRTGMPSAIIGKAVAASIRDMISGSEIPTHRASMAAMGAACVASTGKGLFTGTAASMTVFPVVPDYKKYPRYGRDEKLSYGEIGLAGHWMKYILHHMFLYKAKLKPGWSLIPD